MFHFKIAVICMLSIWAASIKGDYGNQDLAAHILSDYAKSVAPEFTTVKLEISLQRIVNLDITKKVLSLDTWFGMYWDDSRLAWDKDEEFENISQLALPANSLWIPDITLYNSADGYTEFNKEVKVTVRQGGQVLFIPPKKFSSYCNIDDVYTGIGNVTCFLKFGSWAYDGNQLDLFAKSEGWDTSNLDLDYNRNWKYVDSSYERNVKSYACCLEFYVDVNFVITLQPVETFNAL